MSDAGLPLAEKRRWSLRRILGLIAFLIIVGLTVGIWLEYRRVDRMLAQAIAEADRDDPNWRLADLIKSHATIPDGENSALIVKKAAEGLRSDDSHYTEETKLTELLNRLRKSSTNTALNPDDLAHSANSLDPFKPNREQAHKLIDCPRGYTKITPARFYLGTDCSAAKPARVVSRLLEIDALAKANSGDSDGAIASCIAMLNAGRSIGESPFLIPQLIRLSIVSSALDTTARVLGVCSPSDRTLERLQILLSDELEQPTMLFAMQGELAGDDDVMQKLETGELNFFDIVSDASQEFSPDPPRKSLRYPFIGWFFRGQRANTLAWMSDAVRISRLPIGEQESRWDEFAERINKAKANPVRSAKDSLMPMLLLPGASGFYRSQAQRDGHQNDDRSARRRTLSPQDRTLAKHRL